MSDTKENNTNTDQNKVEPSEYIIMTVNEEMYKIRGVMSAGQPDAVSFFNPQTRQVIFVIPTANIRVVALNSKNEDVMQFVEGDGELSTVGNVTYLQ